MMKTKEVAEEAIKRCLFEPIEPSIVIENMKVPLVFVGKIIEVVEERFMEFGDSGHE